MTTSGVTTRLWRGAWREGHRALAPEVPVALVYDGGTEVVMMASPNDLEDFGVGFSCNERIVEGAADIESLDVVAVAHGIEVRMNLSRDRRERLVERRRLRAGPAGCGLCGIESLAEAVPSLPVVSSSLSLRVETLVEAMASLPGLQPLNQQTSAMHAAAFFMPGEGIVAVREDVGRHNALDKLQGYLIRRGIPASRGAVLMTSRISVELVQKAAVMGVPILAAISAPTSLAIAQARLASLTLAGIVRADGLEVFCGEERLIHAA